MTRRSMQKVKLMVHESCDENFCKGIPQRKHFQQVPSPGGGGVLLYISYIGMYVPPQGNHESVYTYLSFQVNSKEREVSKIYYSS